MSRIVITIDGLPDGATVAVSPPQNPAAPAAFAEAALLQGAKPVCPIHHTSHRVEAGVSKKSGKAYKAFYGCDEPNCSWKVDAQ